jgi:hypothetical protein
MSNMFQELENLQKMKTIKKKKKENKLIHMDKFLNPGVPEEPPAQDAEAAAGDVIINPIDKKPGKIGGEGTPSFIKMRQVSNLRHNRIDFPNEPA